MRYDDRGSGLSDRDASEYSLEAWLADLEAVVDAARLSSFVLLGMSQGGAVAVEYVRAHPERVTSLVLWGAYGQGASARSATEEETEERDLRSRMITVGWGRADPVFRRVFTSSFIPGATEAQMRWFDEKVDTSDCSIPALRSSTASPPHSVASLPGILCLSHELRLAEEAWFVPSAAPRARDVPASASVRTQPSPHPRHRVQLMLSQSPPPRSRAGRTLPDHRPTGHRRLRPEWPGALVRPINFEAPETFTHIDGWSGAKGTIDFDTGSNRTVGVAIQRSSAWVRQRRSMHLDRIREPVRPARGLDPHARRVPVVVVQGDTLDEDVVARYLQTGELIGMKGRRKAHNSRVRRLRCGRVSHRTPNVRDREYVAKHVRLHDQGAHAGDVR